jgi:hypothetical protein
MPEPNIHFDYAHILLSDEGCEDEFKEDRLSKSGCLTIMIGNNRFLEMHGVTIPTYGREKLSSEKDIIASAGRIVGDLEDNLEKYAGLSNEGIVQGDLYFTSEGLYDYSRAGELEGKRVTEWIRHAKEYPSTLKELLPKSVEGRDDAIIKIISPTFQTLKDINTLERKSGDMNVITSPTFAEGISNFLTMYDAVASHLQWRSEEENKLRREHRKRGEMYNEDKVKLAELIIPNS